MKPFTIYPAIDLKAGKVVRLTQGRLKSQKTFEISPQEAAEMWIGQGADWLHVVNLDGAFGGYLGPNLTAVERILAVARDNAAIQLGGGLHSMASISQMLNLGVARVILGTAAVTNPGLVCDAISTFGSDRVVLGMDARDNLVRIAGWEQETDVTPLQLARRYMECGLRRVIFTNVSRDGMGSGVDIASSKELAEKTKLEVIASGGVGSLEDIYQVRDAGLPGVVVGKALYENKFTLKEALGC
jgi:phosphoribosylformimino-5-aminoimidazole carboxamide ribotide isomerase